jgi:anti-anti-sigma factor
LALTYLRRQPVLPDRHATRSNVLTVSGVADTHNSSTALTVSVVGEVDADNAKSFADQVCALLAGAHRSSEDITVDLSGVDFIAVDGCTALHAVNALVMRTGASWTVVPSRAVARLLEVCDPASLIPLTRAEELAEPA